MVLMVVAMTIPTMTAIMVEIIMICDASIWWVMGSSRKKWHMPNRVAVTVDNGKVSMPNRLGVSNWLNMPNHVPTYTGIRRAYDGHLQAHISGTRVIAFGCPRAGWDTILLGILMRF